MRFRPSGFPAVTFAGPLAAASALLSVTTPGSARAAMPPSEAAAPVGALLADPARLVAWLRARNADVGAAAARVREAQGDLGQSRLRPNPALAFSLSDGEARDVIAMARRKSAAPGTRVAGRPLPKRPAPFNPVRRGDSHAPPFDQDAAINERVELIILERK